MVYLFSDMQISGEEFSSWNLLRMSPYNYLNFLLAPKIRKQCSVLHGRISVNLGILLFRDLFSFDFRNFKFSGDDSGFSLGSLIVIPHTCITLIYQLLQLLRFSRDKQDLVNSVYMCLREKNKQITVPR